MQRFNGATAMKPWKSAASAELDRVGPMLQWGHGDEAVEEAATVEPIAVDVDASMGPRR